MSANVRTDCFYNLTVQERLIITKNHNSAYLAEIYRTYAGWMLLPLALIGIVTTTFFLVTTYKAIRQRRVSRKCHVLLFNRGIGDEISCIVALACSFYTITSPSVNSDVVFLIESFFISSFWSAMVSYSSLSVLKLYAVWKPLDYRYTVTMGKCIGIIVLSWIMFIIIGMVTLGVTAIVKIPYLAEWSGCKSETCLRTMYRIRNFFTVSIYSFTVVVFIITVLVINRARARSSSLRSRDSSTGSEGGRWNSSKSSRDSEPECGHRRVVRKGLRFPMWKLALAVATFAFLHSFYVAWCVGMLLNQNQCFFQRNYDEMMKLLSFVRLTMVLRIIVDNVICFVTDYQLRNIFFEMWDASRRKVSSAFGSSQQSSIKHDEQRERDSSTSSTYVPSATSPIESVCATDNGKVFPA